MAGGNPADYIAQWDGTSWSAMGSGMTSNIPSPQVQAFEAYNNNLCVSGAFNTANGVATNYIAKWDGSVFSPVGTGMNTVTSSLRVYNGYLYAGGAFQTASGTAASRIARWDGTSWTALGSGMGPNAITTTVLAIAGYNGDIYAGGIFTSAGGNPVSFIVKWNGIAWSDVGGSFTMAGGIPANYIAKWDGATWSDVAGGMDANVRSFAVYNGELYTCGGFTMAGGIPASHIARLTVNTGMNDAIHTQNKITVYPNPVSDLLHIRWSNLTSGSALIVIKDVLGKELLNKQSSCIEDMIDVSTLPAGFYFLTAAFKNGDSYYTGFIISK